MRACTRSLLLLCLFVCLGAAQAAPKNDVRVVIDVSGSMKQTDPRNLRAPALRLLVGLLPETETRAGVWTFGQYVNMAVRLGPVDARWKQRARRESDKIHSRGLYTNIEEALKQASAGWNRPDKQTRRNLILLTDGMVDISRNAQRNAASRKRILTTLLPRIKRSGAHVHTIALSDKVDTDLLRQISAVTGGSYIQADNAGMLERAFLKLFERSAPADSLPIRGNRFKVDTSVRDMTVLVFREEDTPVSLVTPQGKSTNFEQHPRNFTWHREQSYELITVKKPAAGSWLVKGSSDRDNRVMIVTNLKLATSEIPPALLAGDSLRIEAELLDKDKRITRRAFLNLVEFSLELAGGRKLLLRDENRDGRYVADLARHLPGGEQDLIVRAKGPTFERELRYGISHFLRIAEVKLSEDKDKAGFYLSVIPHVEILDPEGLHIRASLDDGKAVALHEEPGGLWLAEIGRDEQGRFVEIHIDGKRHNGQKVAASVRKKLVLAGAEEKVVEHGKEAEQAPAEEAHAPAAGEHGEEEAQSEEPADAHSEEEQETNWLMIGWITMLVNIVAGIIGVLGFQFWKKKKAAQDAEDEKDTTV